MKKIILIVCVLLTVLFQINYSHAATTVRVSEPIPGLGCSEVSGSGGGGTAKLYDCKVEKGAGSVIKMIGNIIKYFTFIAGLVGVLFVVYSGIMYSMGGIDESAKTAAKDRIKITIIGLLILFLSGPFLELVAPWVYG